MKVYKRDEFKVLLPGNQVQEVSEKSNDSITNGIEPYPPKGSKPQDPKDGDSDDQNRDSDDNSSGTENSPAKPTVAKKGDTSRRYEKVQQDGAGGILTEEDSRELQKDLGIEEKVPTKADQEKWLDRAIKNKDLLKDPQNVSGDNEPGHGSRKSMGGFGTGTLKEAIMTIYKEKVDWRKELKRFIGSLLTGREERGFNKKHMSRGDYFTGERDIVNTISNAAIGVDTTGSVSADFPEFVSEVINLTQAKSIKNTYVIPFASEVHDAFVIKRPTKATPDMFEHVGLGGGYENVHAVVDYIKDNIKGDPAFFVVLTDGYMGSIHSKGFPKCPSWGYKTIWVVYGNATFEVPKQWGKVVHVDFTEEEKSKYTKKK